MSVEPPAEPAAGFRARGRVRRRARFLRKARELAYRDLGGLVFNLHRFGQRNDALVLAKLATLTQIDSELRSIEAALSAHQPVTVLREAGIAACPRCAAIHAGEDRFCPACGLPLSRHVDLPISGAVSAPQPATAPAAPQGAAAASVPGGQAPPEGAPASTAPAPASATAPPESPPDAAAAHAPPPASPARARQPSDGAGPEPAPDTPAPRPPGTSAPASAAPAPASPGRSPSPSTKAKPPAPGSDDADEQPTQIFSSRGSST